MTEQATRRYSGWGPARGEACTLSGRAAVTLDNVSVRRGGAAILSEVSQAVPLGAVTAVVGPSGAGKTTLIRVLNGLILPDRGSVTVDAVGLLHCPHTLRRHRSRTATIFQDHALIDRLSALDNVLLGLADLRHPLSPLPWPRELRLRAALALDDVGLLHCAGLPVARLSGGERQRVGIARALVRQPQLLLADEPFAAMDPALVRHLSQDLRQAVVRTGLSLVIVLHQIDVALAMADHVIGLSKGRVAFSGPPQDFDAAAQARLFHHEQMCEGNDD